ncbi:hypothetical protein JR316_0002819, partial [Psilocybe cubensis]
MTVLLKKLGQLNAGNDLPPRTKSMLIGTAYSFLKKKFLKFRRVPGLQDTASGDSMWDHIKMGGTHTVDFQITSTLVIEKGMTVNS